MKCDQAAHNKTSARINKLDKETKHRLVETAWIQATTAIKKRKERDAQVDTDRVNAMQKKYKHRVSSQAKRKRKADAVSTVEPWKTPDGDKLLSVKQQTKLLHQQLKFLRDVKNMGREAALSSKGKPLDIDDLRWRIKQILQKHPNLYADDDPGSALAAEPVRKKQKQSVAKITPHAKKPTPPAKKASGKAKRNDDAAWTMHKQ